MKFITAVAIITLLGCSSAAEQRIGSRMNSLEQRLQAVEQQQAKPPEQEKDAEKYWREKGEAEYRGQQQKAHDPLGQKVGFQYSVFVTASGQQREKVDPTHFTGIGYELEVHERADAYCKRLAIVTYDEGEVKNVVSIDEALGQVDHVKIEQDEQSVGLFLTRDGLHAQPPILNAGEAVQIFKHYEEENRQFVQQYGIESRIHDYSPKIMLPVLD